MYDVKCHFGGGAGWFWHRVRVGSYEVSHGMKRMSLIEGTRDTLNDLFHLVMAMDWMAGILLH